jgi:predicted metal-binding membrane protein
VTPERLLERSGAISLAALGAMTALAWAYLLTGAGMGAGAPGFAILIVMWAAMMVAMMSPSAAPTVLLYARAQRLAEPDVQPPTAAFVGGYLLCWLAFAVLAAGLQIALGRAAALSGMNMALHGRAARSAVMIAAGVYQLSPFKDVCLGRCRSPAQFLSRHYRPGAAGALRLGLLHGAYCVGCCWLLMALLFVGGVMNLLWIAGLTLLVAGEKLLPRGPMIARVTGIALIGWGLARLLV